VAGAQLRFLLCPGEIRGGQRRADGFATMAVDDDNFFRG